MLNNTELIVLIVIGLVIVLIMIPRKTDCNVANKKESFATEQEMTNFNSNIANGIDPMRVNEQELKPRTQFKNLESLIFDDVTGTIMTGTQFMENTGIVAPPWVAPAWDPDAYGPSSKGELNPGDYENDPRMLYNKCSLACCSAQYPTPFQGVVDPFVCGKDGKSKYLASDYVCQNNTGGTGCLCMTQKQTDGMYRGFVDYYVDKEKLGY